MMGPDEERGLRRIRACTIDETARVMPFVNLYECQIGADAFIGPFVEVQRNVVIGDRTRVSSHSFICEGVTIGHDSFIGHGVMFINDLYDAPEVADPKWVMRKTHVGNRVRIGSNATILPVTIGDRAIIGAGAVVTRDVAPGDTVSGVPARPHSRTTAVEGA